MVHHHTQFMAGPSSLKSSRYISALMDSQASAQVTTRNSHKLRGPTYEQVFAILTDARNTVKMNYTLITSARNKDSKTAMSSPHLTHAFLANLKDGLDECEARKESPQDILNSRIEIEHDVLEFWNRSGRMSENKDAVDEDIENFPLQLAAVEAGIKFRPPPMLKEVRESKVDGQGAEVQQSKFPRQGYVVPGQIQDVTVQLPQSAPPRPFSGTGMPMQLQRGARQDQPLPPYSAVFGADTSQQAQESRAPFQHTSTESYKLLGAHASAVASPIDYTRFLGSVGRAKFQQKGSFGPAGIMDGTSWMDSPVSTGAFSGDEDDEDRYGSMKGSNTLPASFIQTPAPVQQTGVIGAWGDSFNNFSHPDVLGDRGLLSSGYPVHLPQPQSAAIPQKRNHTALDAQESQAEAPKKRKYEKGGYVPAGMGMLLNDTPSTNIPFPRIVMDQPANVTIVELMVFFPRYIHSIDVIERIASNGGTGILLARIMNAHRNLAAPLYGNYFCKALQARMRKMGDKTDDGGYDYTKWTLSSHQSLPGHDADSLDIAGMRTKLEIENFPKVHDARTYPIPFKKLAVGVKKLPSGYDALNLTRCVRYAVAHPDEDWIYPDDFRRMVGHLSGHLLGEVFPVPVTQNHFDREAWLRWRNVRG
ncbi:hypothetical protein P171DRAFT_439526 [Karstenula rhodostoma CBS 690.94]|uniref:Uncharacterized protein n=1 Tax=Karstenula rhodostoma CBS 690.94 TaxID=1392251 RepID=A0A9P4UJ53_9PLEO|nr:hypothetical protein P171DRAFT_439526 [Karstenula rhodostoma CBS 690.94]